MSWRAHARDGYALPEAFCGGSPPGWLREIPAARVLPQNDTPTAAGNGREVTRVREKEPRDRGLPPGHLQIASAFGAGARRGLNGRRHPRRPRGQGPGSRTALPGSGCLSAAVATFAVSDCGPCPARAPCTTGGKR
jgi:hypothetical protein